MKDKIVKRHVIITIITAILMCIGIALYLMIPRQDMAICAIIEAAYFGFNLSETLVWVYIK